MPVRQLVIRLGLVVCLCSVPALAQKYGITKTTLENGLDVIVIHNPSVPLVTIEIDVKNGAYTEPPDYDGLSHLYEHMFFKANKAIPNQEKYLDRLRELGASWNGTTSSEQVNYFFTLPKDSLEPGLVFMYNAITSPLFLEQELVNERPVVTGEYDRAESNPAFLLGRAVEKKVWWKYYSRKNVIGDREVILSTTPHKMRSIQSRFYVPNNSALLLSGDVTQDEGLRLVSKYFSSWKRGPNPFDTFPIPEHPPIQRTDTVVVEKPVNGVTLLIEWHGPSVSKDPAATYAADVLSFILGQQTSRFQRNLVESGLAYSANFNYNTLNHTGPIAIFLRTSAANFDSCRAVLAKELAEMTSPDYFSDEQLQNAKTILAINEQYAREQASQFIHTVGYWWTVAGLDYYLNYIENLSKVTRSDIQQYLRTYVHGKKRVEGILVSPADREALTMLPPEPGKEAQ